MNQHEEETVPVALRQMLAQIDPGRMWKETHHLCSETFAGRRVGTQGHALATHWLRQQFEQVGWHVSAQSFPLTAPVLEVSASPSLAQLDTAGTVVRQFSPRTEFCEHPRSAPHPAVIEGPAIVSSKGGSVQGAWVILEHVPAGSDLTTLAERLAELGAIGLLTPLYATAQGYLVKRVMAGPTMALPILSVRADLLPPLAGSALRATVPVTAHWPDGCNILASLEGNNAKLAQTPLLVSAHYDGVGDDVGGLRLPGATDNTAAVAVLLELVRVLVQAPTPPNRPLLFVAFDAEEVGAQGSRVLASHMKQAGKEPLVLNLDGAARQLEAVWVEVAVQKDHLITALDRAGRWLDIPLVQGTIASDHRQFTQVGFPAVGISVGAMGLHTPADTVEQVQPEALKIAASLLLATIWQLAWEGQAKPDEE